LHKLLRFILVQLTRPIFIVLVPVLIDNAHNGRVVKFFNWILLLFI
jgi:hypothetical protein